MPPSTSYHMCYIHAGYNYPVIETSDEDLFLQESGPAPNPNYNKVLGRRQRVLIDEEVEIEAGTGGNFI